MRRNTNPDEYLNNNLKQTIKNKPRAKTRDDLVAATASILKSIQRRPEREPTPALSPESPHPFGPPRETPTLAGRSTRSPIT